MTLSGRPVKVKAAKAKSGGPGAAAAKACIAQEASALRALSGSGIAPELLAADLTVAGHAAMVVERPPLPSLGHLNRVSGCATHLECGDGGREAGRGDTTASERR